MPWGLFGVCVCVCVCVDWWVLGTVLHVRACCSLALQPQSVRAGGQAGGLPLPRHCRSRSTTATCCHRHAELRKDKAERAPGGVTPGENPAYHAAVARAHQVLGYCMATCVCVCVCVSCCGGAVARCHDIVLWVIGPLRFRAAAPQAPPQLCMSVQPHTRTARLSTAMLSTAPLHPT